MNRMVTIFILSVLPFLGYAQPPDWVRELGVSSKYPASLYVTGFGIVQLGADKDRGRCIRLAEEHARGNVAQSICVNIQSSVSSQSQERDREVSHFVQAITQSRSTLQVQGLSLEQYFDDRQKTAYCLAYIRRNQLQEIYADKILRLKKEISQIQQRATKAESDAQYETALTAYLQCNPLLDQLIEAQMIIATVGNSAGMNSADETTEVTFADIRDKVERLINRPLRSMDDLAWHIAYRLKGQMNNSEMVFQVAPFVYQDSKMSSAFSRYFKQILENKLIEVSRWRVAAQMAGLNEDLRGVSREYALAPQTGYLISGSYWPRDESVQVIATVRQAADGKLIASADVEAPLTLFTDSGKDFRPQNFVQAARDQRIFAEGELAGGGLQLEAWTDKGSEGVIYTRGERMKVFVRVNVPCHIRFIYHLADGNRTLLLSSHYIDESKVNRVYEIPGDFECDAPFGAETLQIFASTTPFEPVRTVVQDGYEMLVEDLRTFVRSTRGMKRVQDKSVMKAEQRIVMTTMERSL